MLAQLSGILFLYVHSLTHRNVLEEYLQIEKITFHPVGYEAIMVSLVDYYDVPLYLPIKVVFIKCYLYFSSSATKDEHIPD